MRTQKEKGPQGSAGMGGTGRWGHSEGREHH